MNYNSSQQGAAHKQVLITLCIAAIIIVIAGIGAAWNVQRQQLAGTGTQQRPEPQVSLTPEQKEIRDKMVSGLNHQDKQEYDQARADYEAVIAKGHTEFELSAQNNLAATYLIQENWQAAIEPLKKAIALDASYMAGHLNLGLAYCRLGDLKNAQAEYDIAKKIPQSDFLGNLIKEGCQKK